MASARQAQNATQPNIIMIMGDDIGWANIGVYNQGIMAGKTPNLEAVKAQIEKARAAHGQ